MSKLAHNVYFSLNEPTDANRRALIGACKTYLPDPPGTLFFGVGTVEPELARSVNQRDFDVSLHLVFASRADHDIYQDAPRHHQFVDENKPNWATVRVFDSIVE